MQINMAVCGMRNAQCIRAPLLTLTFDNILCECGAGHDAIKEAADDQFWKIPGRLRPIMLVTGWRARIMQSSVLFCECAPLLMFACASGVACVYIVLVRYGVRICISHYLL